MVFVPISVRVPAAGNSSTASRRDARNSADSPHRSGWKMAISATVAQITTGTSLLAQDSVAAETDDHLSATGAAGTHEARRAAARVAMDADTLLVERCLSGEQDAWEELVRIHTRRVYSICYRFTGSDSHAQDLTQDVFLRVFRSLKTFRAGEGSF